MWRHFCFKTFRHDILVFLNLDFGMLGNYTLKLYFYRTFLFHPRFHSFVLTIPIVFSGLYLVIKSSQLFAPICGIFHWYFVSSASEK